MGVNSVQVPESWCVHLRIILVTIRRYYNNSLLAFPAKCSHTRSIETVDFFFSASKIHSGRQCARSTNNNTEMRYGQSVYIFFYYKIHSFHIVTSGR